MSRELIRITTVAQFLVLAALALLTVPALSDWNAVALLGMGGILLVWSQFVRRERNDPLAPYHFAQSLLRRLIDLSDGLDTGLDPVSLGGAILDQVHDELPASALALYVPRDDTLVPLVTKAIELPGAALLPAGHIGGAGIAGGEDAAIAAWTQNRMVVCRRYAALPISSGKGVSAVVVAMLSDRTDLHALGVAGRLRRLGSKLRPSAVHLDTALLFAAFRDAATTEERRRLAREMHDGVAQEIASLGYLVDALPPASPAQAEQLAFLRERITGVVAEVRRSLVNLRTTVGASESLGAALGSIARHLSEASGVPIEVTVDEQPDRLRPEVEGELFRIAQEAMTNAVKHATEDRVHAPMPIEVHCLVRAPQATITVTDHGPGLAANGPTPSRQGSHGLSIMRERALLINGDLSLTPTRGGGLTVCVTVPASVASPVAGSLPGRLTVPAPASSPEASASLLTA